MKCLPLVSVAVRLGSRVAGTGAVAGVCSTVGGRVGAADSALGASSEGTGGGPSHTVLHQDPAGGRQR